MSLKPRRGPRKMSLATKLHGARRKRNPDDTKEQLEEIRKDAQQFMEENEELMGKLADSKCSKCARELTGPELEICYECGGLG